MYDTGAVTVIDEAAFAHLGGEVMPCDVTLTGAFGTAIPIKKIALLRVNTGHKAADIPAYVIPGKAGMMLISELHGRELGIHIVGLPFLEDLVEPSVIDEDWLKEEKVRDEVKVTGQQLEDFMKIIQPELDRNALLPDSTHCSREDSCYIIRIDGDKPVYTWQYPIAHAMRPKVTQRVQEWLKNQWIREAKAGGRYNQPLNPQPKKSGGVIAFDDIRLCMDSRKLNKINRGFEYLLPLVSEILNDLGGSKYVSELDLMNAFHQIELHESCREFTAFTDPGSGKRYEWCRMYFGDIGAANKMQYEMDRTLKIGTSSAVNRRAYIDNVLIFDKTGDILSHAREVRDAISLLTDDSFKIRPEKCKFAYTRLRTLGHLVSGSDAAIDPLKIAAFMTFVRPKTGTQVESLLGFANYLRDYIPLFSNITAPLDKLRKTKTITDEIWTEEQQSAFETLKAALSNAPVLHQPIPGIPFRVGTDASQFGVGAVLYQIVDGKPRYIAFASKALTGSQKNYSATKRELLGIIFALKKWKVYLIGSAFTLETDHKALKYINSAKSYMIRDWAAFLQQFDMDIIHKPGFLNILPHHLSHLYDLVPLDSRQHQIAAIEIDADESQNIFTRMKSFAKDVLEKKEPESTQAGHELLTGLHEKSHQGAQGLFETAFREGYYWPEMMAQSRKISKSCSECLRFNVGKRGFHPLRPILTLLPLDVVLWDIAGPFPTTDDGSNYVLVIIDVLSKYVWLKTLKTKSSSAVVPALIDVITQFGRPSVLQSDNDHALVNQVTQRLADELDYELRTSAEYNPEQNGHVENIIREMKQILNKKLSGENNRWSHLIPWIQLALNERIATKTKSSPFAVMLGRKSSILNRLPEDSVVNLESSLEQALISAKAMDETVWPSIAQSSKAKGLADCEATDKGRRVRQKPLPIGTQAMILREQRANKLEERYDGPYTVVQFNSRSKAYRVTDLLGNLVKRVVPLSKLKPLEYRVPKEELQKHWEVSKVVAHRGPPGKREYSTLWKGWKGATWVRETDFSSKECIKDYWKSEKSNRTAPSTPTQEPTPSTPPIRLLSPPSEPPTLQLAYIYSHIPDPNSKKEPTTKRQAFIVNPDFLIPTPSPRTPSPSSTFP
jgi:hypothetical protein